MLVDWEWVGAGGVEHFFRSDTPVATTKRSNEQITNSCFIEQINLARNDKISKHYFAMKWWLLSRREIHKPAQPSFSNSLSHWQREQIQEMKRKIKHRNTICPPHECCCCAVLGKWHWLVGGLCNLWILLYFIGVVAWECNNSSSNIVLYSTYTLTLECIAQPEQKYR